MEQEVDIMIIATPDHGIAPEPWHSLRSRQARLCRKALLPQSTVKVELLIALQKKYK